MDDTHLCINKTKENQKNYSCLIELYHNIPPHSNAIQYSLQLLEKIFEIIEQMRNVFTKNSYKAYSPVKPVKPENIERLNTDMNDLIEF